MYSFRNFIIAIAGSLALLVASAQPVQAKDNVQYFLTLDGVKVGILASVEGGDIFAEVISERVGSSYYIKKHIGTPRYEDIAISFGGDMGRAMYEWIKGAVQHNYSRKDGSITKVVDGNAVGETQFFQALISEVRFPAVNAASKQEAYITVKIAPEYVRYIRLSPNVNVNLGVWPSNSAGLSEAKFNLTISGLNTSQVSQIDGLVIKQAIITDDIGDARDYIKEPGRLEFPNIVLYMCEESPAAESFLAWHKDFVVEGDNDESNEKSGSLEYFVQGSATPVLKMDLYNLGIFRVGLERVGKDGTSRVKVQMYCERIELSQFPSTEMP